MPSELNYDNDAQFSPHAMARLRSGYMRDDENSPQERFRFVADSFSSNPEHADRMYTYLTELWLSLSTPILSYGKNKKALPISCFLVNVEDTADSLLHKSTESRVLTMLGGGIGIGMGVRPRDEKSSGVFPHLKTYDADTVAWKQGETRRGAYAAYLDVSHPEITEFIALRDPFGGDVNRKALNLHHGVNLSDEFMNRVKQLFTNDKLTKEQIDALDQWGMTHSGSDKVTVGSVKQIWQSTIEARYATGEPYMHYIDTSNANIPEYQQELGLKCTMSNLCAEIIQCNNRGIDGNARTAVCCLSSVNLAKWEEWKSHPTFIADVVEFLDNVLQRFIDDGEAIPEIADAVFSAKRERSIGIGALGWHDLLQSQRLPFESALATSLNREIFAQIKKQALVATKDLAKSRGACLDWEHSFSLMKQRNVVDEGVWLEKNPEVRNANLLAIAPNASSSIILGTSPSIEPYRANIYREEGEQGVYVRKNKHLESLLEEKGINTQDTWSDIIAHDGSVQHMDVLSPWEKDVFKTAMEIDQRWVVNHAADRQEWICQSQSLNLFFLPDEDIAYVSYVHILAWEKGLKTLYYMRSDTISKAAKLGKSIEREKINQIAEFVASDGDDVCLACE